MKICELCKKQFKPKYNYIRLCKKCKKKYLSMLKPKVKQDYLTREWKEEKKFSVDAYKEKYRTPCIREKQKRDRWKYREKQGCEHFDTVSEMKNIGRAFQYYREMNNGT